MPGLQLPPARDSRASREFEELRGSFEEKHCKSVLTQEAEISNNNFTNSIQDGAHTLAVTKLDLGGGKWKTKKLKQLKLHISNTADGQGQLLARPMRSKNGNRTGGGREHYQRKGKLGLAVAQISTLIYMESISYFSTESPLDEQGLL